MSNICKDTPPITSESQLLVPFPNAIMPREQLERNSSDQRLTNAAMENLYSRLVSQGKLISNQRYKQLLNAIANQKDKDVQQKTLETVGQQEKQTMDALQNEFCYTYVRYKFALEDLFETLTRTSSASSLTIAQRKTIETKISRAKELNMRLNDLIQFTNFLANKRASEMRDQNSNINTLNSSLADIYGRLQKQNEILRQESSITDLRQRMVEFTQEKNQSATNLLSLYGFLNLVAVGLLFYIARS
jgi:hypothetical protein